MAEDQEYRVNFDNDLERIGNPLFPEDRIKGIIDYYSPLLDSLDFVLEYSKSKEAEGDSSWIVVPQEDREDWEEMYYKLVDIRKSWEEVEKEYLSPETTEERKQEILYSVEEWYLNFMLLHEYNKPREFAPGEKVPPFSNYPKNLPPYRIEIDPKTGERTESKEKVHLWGDNYFVPGEGILKVLHKNKALEELQKLSSLPSLGQVNISKDLVSSQYSSQGDILEIGTEEEKKMIREYQRKGKLLFGTLEGLSGGTAYFKSVSIALAKILNEQSRYYHPGEVGDKKGGLLHSGVPRDTIKEIFGDSAKLEAGSKTPTINNEIRTFPYILLSYERLAKELSKTGRVSGGKDIDGIRLYINGGYREFTTDPKTGNRVPVKSSYTQGLTSKRYPISNGKGGFIFVPFVVNEGEIVDTSRSNPEVGCLLRLSPQFSKTLRGYTALRGDTIQLIGGGRQKDITMDILSFLAFSRGGTKILRKKKTELLSKYVDRPTYYDKETGRRRPGKLEAHFQEAIEKAISAKILLPGKDSKGKPLGYREERNSGGEVISVFYYNPDYLKGEEMYQEQGEEYPE